jgi:hypothetical protein
MRGLIGYLRRHHWGMLATFIALGGTAYAAAALPPNSVGTRQLQRGAVTLEKINRSARTDGYYAPVGSGPGEGGASVTVPPGDYIAFGGCTAWQTKTDSQSDTVPALGMARGILTDHPEEIATGAITGSVTYASVPNLGETSLFGAKEGSASLANGTAFSFPRGGTIAEVCGEASAGHGFGASDWPLSFSNGFVTAIRVGTLNGR